MTGAGPAEPGGKAGRRRSLPGTFLLIAVLLGLFLWRTGSLAPPEVAPPAGLEPPAPVISRNQAPREGYLSPLFEARTMEGRAVRLEELRGQPVFINFWAPWCGPCRAEMAAIQRLADRAPGDVRVLAIAVDSREADIRRFLDRYELALPVIHDEDRALGGGAGLGSSGFRRLAREAGRHAGRISAWNPPAAMVEFRALKIPPRGAPRCPQGPELSTPPPGGRMARRATRRSARPLARDSSHPRRRWPWLVLIIVTVTVIAASTGDQGLVRLLQLRSDYARIQDQNADLQADNVRLEAEVKRLRENPLAIEKIAREDLGMVKGDEIVYQTSP